jgi:formylglycine-generating enzyme required for sulfatase activity
MYRMRAFVAVVVVGVGCVRGGFDRANPNAPRLDANGTRSDGGSALGCPEDYAEIPALAGYVSSDFCVMRYEARAHHVSTGEVVPWGCTATDEILTSDESCTEVAADWQANLSSLVRAAARPEGLPWRLVRRQAAIDACQSLGAGYDLITNDEWQAVARDIEGVASNWKEGKVGGVSTGLGGTNDNLLNHGHADNDPARPLAASADDAAGCVGIGSGEANSPDGHCAEGWQLEKRTHQLSRGAVIWDFAGNLWEWVKDDNAEDYGGDEGVPLSRVTSASHPQPYALSGGTTETPRTLKGQFGPQRDYTSLNQYPDYGALGFAFLHVVTGAVIRSGRWSAGRHSGIFYVRLVNGPGAAYPFLGFRCVFHP